MTIPINRQESRRRTFVKYLEEVMSSRNVSVKSQLLVLVYVLNIYIYICIYTLYVYVYIYVGMYICIYEYSFLLCKHYDCYHPALVLIAKLLLVSHFLESLKPWPRSQEFWVASVYSPLDHFIVACRGQKYIKFTIGVVSDRTQKASVVFTIKYRLFELM